MRSFGTLVIAFLVSGFVAGIVQNQLAVALGAREEFIAVMILFVMSTVVAIVVFGIALAFARSAAALDWTALALLILTAVVLVALAAIGSGGGRFVVTRQDLPILAEIIVPTAVMIAIQWWFVRRRWVRSRRPG